MQFANKNKKYRKPTGKERIKRLKISIEDLKKLGGFENVIKDYEQQLKELKEEEENEH